MSFVDFIQNMQRDYDPKIIEAKWEEYDGDTDFPSEVECIYKEGLGTKGMGAKAFIKQFIDMTGPNYNLIAIRKTRRYLHIDQLKDGFLVTHTYKGPIKIIRSELKKYPKAIRKMFKEVRDALNTDDYIETPFGHTLMNPTTF